MKNFSEISEISQNIQSKNPIQSNIPIPSFINNQDKFEMNEHKEGGRVAVEWMRLMSGGGRVLEAPSNGSSDASSGGAGACLLADLGIRGGVNLFLTARVEGMQYGRG